MSKPMQVLDEILSFPNPFLFTILSIFFVILIKRVFYNRINLVLPPSPSKFPIIGNLHNLGSLPHRSLHDLSQRLGPLMLLRFGNVPILVVSSSDAAKEIMKTHDLTFSNRPKMISSEKLLYDYKDVSSAPYGEYWRQLKSICVLNLLSNRRVKSFRGVREEEIGILVERIEKSCSSNLPQNLTEIFVTLTNNVVSRVALGRKHGEGEDGVQFQQLLHEFQQLLGAFAVGDYIPWLAWVDRFNGLESKMKKVARSFDDFLERVVEEHMEMNKKDDEEHKDLVDVLLEIQKEKSIGFPLEKVSIKALILDMFAAGTDTSYTVLEWTMTELLKNPNIMDKLQTETRQVSGNKPDISEDDLEKMQYLKAVIKETLRLHPPIPLLVPRICTKDVKIKSYDIAKGTQVFINAWAIGRDLTVWEKPEEFIPERFLNNSVDYKGQDFELIPFGSGRRICPGITFAMTLNELFLANLVNKFDWSLPGGAKHEELDMAETSGLTIHRKNSLLAIANPYPFQKVV